MDTLKAAEEQVMEIIIQDDFLLGDLDDLQIAMIMAKKWGLIDEEVAV